ncbi:Acyl transferase domain-containing protein [Stigmatella aurantiaca]|uniref:Phenolphthiocerol/phthiocerol polyketide synthase subunit E n=1 Tax=Stigmatella aurantiaca TaxID=41 RepID=A0A1H8EJI4_STIAU|nr:type I polyketide synthase [Stigmatella aurantiaca]SEN18948.1 Acyl transferase domain-containing protein [Stigmatella aurantiaca]
MSEQWGGPEEAVAIIGMSGRFPGAGSVEELWRNVRAGVESLSLLDDGDLAAAGVDGATASQPGYVRAAFPLEGVDRFDAGFFGLTPREAEILDPQQRLFLECAWSALEDAGYDAESWSRPISLYAGAGASAYLYANLMQRMDVLRSVGTFQAGISNEKDFLATRVAHKLGLRGPCVTVQTACSTSLVAVHMACQALLSGESDLALAGGVSVSLPQRAGYVAREGDILSPDGHCRAFDARAQGTVRGSGVGAVVLKRLSDAVAQGDTIHAVILGSAVNNDGAERVGYTAPGVEGQAAVITEALGVSRVKAGSLQYVEAHGTGTPLGDPIEVSALNQAFRSRAGAPGTIGLGSLKTNIGHLDTAAGIAGLLKVVLALRHQELPPSLHFERPNPGIDFAGGPFYVNATLRPWETDGGPRRAGVSSFGIGGTNAHVILQEAPRAPAASSARSAHLLVLSARNERALEEATSNLAAHLTRHPGLELADVAHTLLVGRRRFSHRRVLVCRDVEDARGALASRDASRVLTHVQEATKRQVVFMFPGQGAQYAGMGRGLYEEVALFRKHVDACCEHLAAHLGMDLRPLLLAKEADTGDAERQLRRTALAQPALFTVSYALAKVWMSWGVKPQAMVGHSVGEYVAACLAGVLKLEDALALVAARGRLMEEMPAGAMLSVSQPEQEVLPLLGSELSLAAVNAPSSCVVAGPVESVAALEARLARAGVAHRRLHTSHAFHSSMMDPLLGAFGERLRAVSWAPPALPWISNVTGTWVRPEQVTNPEYWVEHLRRTVRFGDGVRELLAEPSRVFLEVGPGGTLGTLVRQVSPEPPAVMASMRHPYETRPDLEVLLGAAGGLWLAGVRLDGTKLHAPEPRRRIPLPTYAFQRERYWVDARPSAEATVETPARMTKRPESKGWIYAPAWRQARREGGSRPGGRWLVFAPSESSPIVERLRDRGADVVEVVSSERFEQRGPRCYALDGAQPEHHARLVDALLDGGGPPERVVFLGSVPRASAPHLDAAKVDAALASGFYPSLFFARELSARVPGAEVELTFVTEGAQDVTGEEPLCPAQALALGPCRVLPQELGPAWHCRAVDAVATGGGTQGLDALVAELESEPRDAVVALRAGRRWVEDYAPASLPEPSGPLPLRQGGVYLLTGGLGRMGLAIAGLLASEAQAKLVLMGRTALPEREAWEAWIASHGAEDATARVLQGLLELERRGAEVLAVRADVSREDDVRAALAQARARFGRIHGVVHAAGVVGPGAHVLVQETDVARCEAQFQAKVRGLLVLSQALEAEPPEFMVLQSSLAAVLGGIGFSAYAAANLYMDAFAAQQARQGGTRWLTVDWDGWSETQGRLALTMDEGVRTFRRILAAGEGGRFVVSTGDLAARRLRVARSTKATGATPEPEARAPSHARPVLGTPYVAPRDVIEREIAGLWQELLGIERVGIHDSFFELGGHSLLGTQMVSRVKESFGVEVSIRGLFETPTVAGVAMAVLQAQAAQADAGRLEQLLAELEGAS